MRLRMDDVTFSYPDGQGRRVIFDGATVEFRSGALYSVVGPSGSGKTTLFRLISGEEKPDTGGIELSEASVSASRSSIARIYQEYRLVPYLTALENVQLAQEVHGTLRSAPGEAASLLERLGLAERSGTAAEKLSGGEQQRVAIARAIVDRPQIVLADEPTGALDAENTESIVRLLSDLARDLDLLVIAATHDPLVAGMADHSLRIRDRHVAPA